jgi:CBS domain-containing protein
MNAVLVGSIDAVTRRRLVTTRADALLPEVAKLLSETPVSLVVVCDPHRAIAGVITKTDIVRKLGQSAATAATTAAAEAMTRDVIHCRPSDSLEDVLQLMKKHSLVHVPVIDAHSRPTGVMEARDALRALVADASYEISWLRDYIMGVGYR